MAKNSQTGKIFGELEIIGKSYTVFADLPIDRQGHETYTSKEEQKELFEKYDNRKITDVEPVLVL